MTVARGQLYRTVPVSTIEVGGQLAVRRISDCGWPQGVNHRTGCWPVRPDVTRLTVPVAVRGPALARGRPPGSSVAGPPLPSGLARPPGCPWGRPGQLARHEVDRPSGRPAVGLPVGPSARGPATTRLAPGPSAGSPGLPSVRWEVARASWPRGPSAGSVPRGASWPGGWPN